MGDTLTTIWLLAITGYLVALGFTEKGNESVGLAILGTASIFAAMVCAAVGLMDILARIL